MKILSLTSGRLAPVGKVRKMEKRLSNDKKPAGLRRGAWTEEEDSRLRRCMEKYGAMKWCDLPSKAGLNRCRKSCRLRWLNYLSPTIKRGRFEEDEEDLIIRLHKLLGNRWSLIAGRLPGRTANDIKNHWNTHLSKRSIPKEKPWSTKTIFKGTTREKPKETREEFRIIKPRPRTINPVTWSWLKQYQGPSHGQFQEKIGIPDRPLSSSTKNNTSIEGNATIPYNNLDDNAFLGIDDMPIREVQTNFGVGSIGGNGDEEFFLNGDEGWDAFLLDMDL
ncbi:hypothetical protein J5N97_011588 [Dioscorea zingiberensis]|uniref:Uncharacterized protein n=1 Tax=Dioscorea zingiberensis TaxID=325984 RepID=A0A9D5D3C9_9LILI|nr:hypothetical protein J5N97_011588 [Dioscorea zingiberensis]